VKSTRDLTIRLELFCRLKLALADVDTFAVKYGFQMAVVVWDPEQVPNKDFQHSRNFNRFNSTSMTLSNRAPFRLPTGISSVQIATRVVATQKQFLQSVLLSLSGHAEVERTGDREMAGAQGNAGVGAGEEAGGQGEAGGQEEAGGQGEAGGQEEAVAETPALATTESFLLSMPVKKLGDDDELDEDDLGEFESLYTYTGSSLIDLNEAVGAINARLLLPQISAVENASVVVILALIQELQRLLVIPGETLLFDSSRLVTSRTEYCGPNVGTRMYLDGGRVDALNWRSSPALVRQKMEQLFEVRFTRSSRTHGECTRFKPCQGTVEIVAAEEGLRAIETWYVS
jgi:hypothetical protein